MAIARVTVDRFKGQFLDALGVDSPDARRRVDYKLELATELLPEPDAWVITGQDDDATLILLAGEALFAIAREEVDQIVVTCHPLRPTEVRYRRSGLRTFWTFQFRHRDPLSIEGRFDSRSHPDDAETFDQAETFARALASRIGWRID